MPRNSAGTYSLPAGNPVVPNTVISTVWANGTMGDIATELTNSLDRSGRGTMLAPLLVADGTAGAPSIAFGSQPGTGLYLAGTNDVRLQLSGNEAERWTATGNQMPNGLAVTQAQTDEDAISATGNGEGVGVRGLGGVNSGAAGTNGENGAGLLGIGAGGTTGGRGVMGIGGGTGSAKSGVVGMGNSVSGQGVTGFGGSPDGIGVEGRGTGAGEGVLGIGGATNGPGIRGLGTGNGAGVVGNGGATNGQGVRGTGVGTAAGGAFTGGTSAGSGVTGTGGTSSGSGAIFTGGATDGIGVEGLGTGNGTGGRFSNALGSTAAAMEGRSQSSGAGGFFVNTSTGPALGVHTGHALFSGGNPLASVGFSNTLTPKNIAKAWGTVSTNGAGAATLSDGFNVSAVSIIGAAVQVTFATALANTSYAVMASVDGAPLFVIPAGVSSGTRTTAGFQLASTVDLSTSAAVLSFVVFGAQ